MSIIVNFLPGSPVESPFNGSRELARILLEPFPGKTQTNLMRNQ